MNTTGGRVCLQGWPRVFPAETNPPLPQTWSVRSSTTPCSSTRSPQTARTTLTSNQASPTTCSNTCCYEIRSTVLCTSSISPRVVQQAEAEASKRSVTAVCQQRSVGVKSQNWGFVVVCMLFFFLKLPNRREYVIKKEYIFRPGKIDYCCVSCGLGGKSSGGEYSGRNGGGQL